jgi:nuclear-control-of-ATPase protein 2
MPSTFVQHHVHGLDIVALPASIADTPSPSDATRTLHSLLLSLKWPLTLPQIGEAAEWFASREETTDSQEQVVLENIILDRLVTGIYAHTLDVYLSEAIEAETEAEWWANIERSERNVLLYLIQSE